MLQLLLLAGLAVTSPNGGAYANDTLHLFAALSNNRIIDGVPYGDGGGVLSAGMLFVDTSGFFASTELATFNGDGDFLPAQRLQTLDTAIGWRVHRNGHGLSVTVADYRTRFERHTDAYRGIAFGYHNAGFSVEAGFDDERTYYLAPYRLIVSYDARRIGVSWTRSLGEALTWTGGAGAVEFAGADYRRSFASAGLGGRWRDFEWQALLVASFEHSRAARDPELHALLRLALPFRVD